MRYNSIQCQQQSFIKSDLNTINIIQLHGCVFNENVVKVGQGQSSQCKVIQIFRINAKLFQGISTFLTCKSVVNSGY